MTKHDHFDEPALHRECPYCGGYSSFLLSSPDINRKIDKQNFHYYICQQCDLVYLENCPNNLHEYYEGGYQSIPTNTKNLDSDSKFENYKIDILTKFKTSGKLLEIGPWAGYFSYLAKSAGFDVSAIEADQDCVHFLRNTIGIHAFHSDDPAHILLEMENGVGFDVIALWHSIEHIPRPWILIDAAARCLTPGGVLIIAAPNPESFQFKKLGAKWFHLDAPRHRYLMPMHWIEKVGREAGLKKILATTLDIGSLRETRNGWQFYVRSLFPVRYVRYVFYMTIGLILSSLYRRIESQEGQSSGYTVVLERPKA